MPPKNGFPSHVFLSGDILPLKRAKLSVFDRGFLFGDGIYEVMVQLENGFFYKKAHMDRLQANLDEIGIAYDVGILEEALGPLLQASGLEGKECLVYLQVSRGVAPRKHAFPQGVAPTTMMYALPTTLPRINERSMEGLTLKDLRWHMCHIKSTSLLANVMANSTALTDGFDEGILVRGGQITEGSHTNIFFVREGCLYTHPADRHILNGITRQIVVQLCRQMGLSLIERAVSLEEAPRMEEAFLTGTTTQIASLHQLDGHFYHRPGEIGPMTLRIQEAFAKLRDVDSSLLTL